MPQLWPISDGRVGVRPQPAAAEIALQAFRNDLRLREAAISLGRVTAEDFDRIVDPVEMLGFEG
jgi:fumarate hydratase class II